MAEEVTPITIESDGDMMYPCFSIELSCLSCFEEAEICASTKEELVEKIKEEGWFNLSSDCFQSEGWWCGCEYDVDVPNITMRGSDYENS